MKGPGLEALSSVKAIKAFTAGLALKNDLNDYSWLILVYEDFVFAIVCFLIQCNFFYTLRNVSS